MKKNEYIDLNSIYDQIAPKLQYANEIIGHLRSGVGLGRIFVITENSQYNWSFSILYDWTEKSTAPSLIFCFKRQFVRCLLFISFFFSFHPFSSSSPLFIFFFFLIFCDVIGLSLPCLRKAWLQPWLPCLKIASASYALNK